MLALIRPLSIDLQQTTKIDEATSDDEMSIRTTKEIFNCISEDTVKYITERERTLDPHHPPRHVP